jgi:hypothetical protein
MAVWKLVDGRYPAESPEAFRETVIGSEAELRRELDRLRHLEPATVSIFNPSGEALQIGIGGPFAGIRWHRNPHTSKQSRDILADHPYCPNRVDFASEGDAIAFWPEHLMPVDQAIAIAVYYYQHSELPDWVAWKEWDEVRRQWTIKPGIGVLSA